MTRRRRQTIACLSSLVFVTCSPHSNTTRVGATNKTRARNGSPIIANKSFYPEIFWHGDFHPICGPWFWDNDEGASTICRQHGFPRGSVTEDKSSFDKDAIAVGRCRKRESLAHCTAGANSFANITDGCRKGKHIGVKVTCESKNSRACNWQCYLDRYPELPIAFGRSNFKAAEQHYKIIGRKNGLDCTCPHVQDERCRPRVQARFRLRWDPPAVLYSIPGSGNTMTRLLIDGVLKPYHSSALYRDVRLFRSLPGEKKCTRSASVIKAHPKYDNFKRLFKTGHVRYCSKCIPEPFKAAVVVTRHPLHAFFAEFNRKNGGGHTGRMKKGRFNAEKFKRALLKDARQTRGYYAGDYTRGIVGNMHPDHYIFVRFEDLISKNITVRKLALRRIVSFLAPNTDFTDADLRRGFELSEKEHRPPAKADEISFSDTVTSALAHEYWQVLGSATEALGGYAESTEHARRRLVKGLPPLLFPDQYEDWGT